MISMQIYCRIFEQLREERRCMRFSGGMIATSRFDIIERFSGQSSIPGYLLRERGASNLTHDSYMHYSRR